MRKKTEKPKDYGLRLRSLLEKMRMSYPKSRLAELQKTKKRHKNATDAKDKKIGDLEEELCLAKYSEGLWAKDQTLLRHPTAAAFFS